MTSMFRVTRMRFVLLVLITLLLSACSNTEDKPKPTQAPPAAVTLIDQSPQLYQVGYYGATSQGYFEQENLQASIVFTNSKLEEASADILEQVVAGENAFGIVSADQILNARQQGKPVVAIASIYQRDPSAFIALKSKGITKPEDLIGKSVLVWKNGLMLRVFAAEVGLDLDQVTLVSAPDGNLVAGSTMFVTGAVDAMIGYGTDAEAQLPASGIDIDLIYFDEYGVANYPLVVFTTEAMIEEHPDIVQHFVTAFVRGMQYAVRNPDVMGTWYLENYGDQILPNQKNALPALMEANLPLIAPSDTQPGVMRPEIWQAVYDGMVTAELIEPLDVSQAFTRKFVDTYYK